MTVRVRVATSYPPSSSVTFTLIVFSPTVVKVQGGTPVRVRDLGQVVQAPKVRLGQLGKAIRKEDGTIIDSDDVVEGIVLLRKGAVAETTLAALHKKIDELNGTNGNHGLLPVGVKLVPHLDRSELMKHTTHTVLRNLTDGVLLVTLILFLFLGNVRSALIVAVTIPFSLLFAAILLDLRQIPANLLSLGALEPWAAARAAAKTRGVAW